MKRRLLKKRIASLLRVKSTAKLPPPAGPQVTTVAMTAAREHWEEEQPG